MVIICVYRWSSLMSIYEREEVPDEHVKEGGAS